MYNEIWGTLGFGSGWQPAGCRQMGEVQVGVGNARNCCAYVHTTHPHHWTHNTPHRVVHHYEYSTPQDMQHTAMQCMENQWSRMNGRQ